MYLSTLKRNWFVFTSASNLLLLWMILKIINNFPESIIGPTRKKEISSYLSCFIARIIFHLNPHIQVKILSNWNLVKNDRPNIFLINHTSPIDALLFAAMLPLKHAAKIRTLFKSDLLEVPVFGDIVRYCGHFPVHFVNSELNNFSVDKQKQNQVIRDIKNHISNGGHIAFFPEGQLNRTDTRQLQPFRSGLFQVFSELYTTNQATTSPNISMYCFLHIGLEKTWHPTAKIGGNPSIVRCKVSPLVFREIKSQEVQKSVQSELDELTLHKYLRKKSKL